MILRNQQLYISKLTRDPDVEPLSALYRPSKSAGAGSRVNSPLSVYTTIVKSQQTTIVIVHV